MKKKLLSMLLIFGLVFVFAACGSDDSDYESGVDEIEFEEETTDSGDVSSEDELYLLAWEPNEENSENFFLLRDNQNYSLNTIDADKAVGVLPVIVYGSKDYGHGGCIIYGDMMETGALPEVARDGFFSYGNIPVPVIEEGDKVVSYSSRGVPELMLKKLDFYGYAIRLKTFSKGYIIIDDAIGSVTLPFDGTEVVDSSGETVDDIYDLNEGEQYIVSWYEGTQYKEASLPADSRFYVPERGRMGDPEYEIEGTLTKDGYAEYDLSAVESGTYMIISGNDRDCQGLITIE